MDAFSFFGKLRRKAPRFDQNGENAYSKLSIISHKRISVKQRSNRQFYPIGTVSLNPDVPGILFRTALNTDPAFVFRSQKPYFDKPRVSDRAAATAARSINLALSVFVALPCAIPLSAGLCGRGVTAENLRLCDETATFGA